MPLWWRRVFPNAKASAIGSKLHNFKGHDHGLGGSLLPDICGQRGHSRTKIIAGQEVALRTPFFSAYRGQRDGVAHMRDQGQRRSSADWPASRNSVHQQHPLRRGPDRGLWHTCRGWFRRSEQTLARSDNNGQQWSGEYVSVAESNSSGAEDSRGRYGSIGAFNRLLTGIFARVPLLYQRARSGLLLLVLASFLPLGAANAAASLVIRPTRIEITEKDQVVAVSIENQGASEAVIQLQLMSWSQVDGDDVYGSTEDLGILACPPMFTVPAGQTQVIRVGLENGQRDWSTEGTFRLFIQEIPPAPVEGQTAVQVALRIGVPVFLPPPTTIKPSLDWNIESRGDAGLWATVKNSGNVHALINAMQLASEAGFTFTTNTHQYVLPGATISWRLDTSNPVTVDIPDSLELTATTDQGSYTETVAIGR